MTLAEFDIADFDNMIIKDGCWARREDRPMIEIYASLGPAATLWHDGKIIMCGGIACGAWKGLGDIWLIPSGFVNQCPLGVFKTAKRYIDDVIETLDLHRVQATIAESEVKWIEKLGFVREGVMRKFSRNKEDRYLYARVK
jgi:hypothetical protein